MRHIVGSLLVALGCAQAKAPPTVSVQQLKTELDAGRVPLLVDVRTPQEYASGHVSGAVSLPLSGLTADDPVVAKHKQGPIYVICRSGSRSARAAAQLGAAGYTAINVTGGTLGWTRAGFPVD